MPTGVPWPRPLRAESMTGFWLVSDASWWHVVDDFGACVAVPTLALSRWIASGGVL